MLRTSIKLLRSRAVRGVATEKQQSSGLSFGMCALVYAAMQVTVLKQGV